jgi:hypothetical protein
MKTLWILAAIAGLGMTLPAAAQVTSGGLAQNKVECHTQFRISDLNGDGVLDAAEISDSRGSIPTELSGRDLIWRQEFLSACYNTITSGE